MAKVEPEFDRRGVKIIAVSVDPVNSHDGWARDIQETQGTRRLPGTWRLRLQGLEGLRRCSAPTCPATRPTAPRPTTRPSANIVVGPDGKIELMVTTDDEGEDFDEVLRVIDSLQLTAKHKVRDAGELEAG